ncbi:MAG: transposase domain-containing protein [Candidatus Gastranaerophilales bacterium]|nr:transposase domain-containing protein [Candidatus Gastranaerophilales bacterium]
MKIQAENIWLEIENVCSLTGETKETVRRKCKSQKYTSKSERSGKFVTYSVLLSALPQKVQEIYFEKNAEPSELIIDTGDIDGYSLAPAWARKQADKYLELISITKKMTHSQINAFLQVWNKKYPEKASSYTRIHEARMKYEKFGISALLSKNGNSINKKVIKEEYYEYYKSLYLKEGAPSANSCWRITLGYAKETDDVEIANFPSCRTFDRRLRKEVPEQAIFLARYGEAAWNKKYASYIPRDYSNITAGSFWVSDHAQIDVAVNFNGSVCFPWVTVFRDIKSAKWLGWFLHAESPNSDHIFQSFYYGVLSFGLPNDVYLDNGKDYRCKDFAGGRSGAIKVAHNTSKENSLMKNLGINVHFALPYNAQTKPIERDFLKVKTYLSKHMVGYRGGKITERPEKLKTEIKNEQIMPFEEFKTIFDDFITNVLNKMPSNGKVLQGKCPDELWAEEYSVKKIISKDALKLFCMRTSKDVSIGRNGVYDSQLQITYWDEWMIAKKGTKVYLRRDINAFQEAWVFDAATEEYLGMANANQAVSFMAKTNIEKAQYKKAIEAKNKEKKVLKSYIKCKYNPTNAEIVNNLKSGLSKTDFESNPKISKITNTKMDKVVKSEKKSTFKATKYLTPIKEKEKLYLTETEKKRDMAKRAM